MNSQSYDFVIVGAGILGLSLAKSLAEANPGAKVAVLEKEDRLGVHGSGRNSGVLHSGIYYPENSLKAKLCAQGAKMLGQYCEERKLPLKRLGKVILPTQLGDDPTLELLLGRAKINGARAIKIDAQTLREIEPLAYSITGQAIHVPDCAVVDSRAILKSLADELGTKGCQVKYAQTVQSIRMGEQKIKCASGEEFSFGHLVNAAGLGADRIAHMCDVGLEYVIMPFKGLYYDFVGEDKSKIRGLIYPVPDLRLPFLGVHFTKSVEGKVYVGPNALPALGRENYSGLKGIDVLEAPGILSRNLRQFIKNEQGFRRLVKDEVKRLSKHYFIAAAKTLVPMVKSKDIQRVSKKVGIRAQLYDTKQKRLEMDFLVQSAEKSTHILNAVSPGFTCAPSFAEHVVRNLMRL